MARSLSPPHWILLAVAHASDSNLTALRTLYLAKRSILKAELVLRILLTYLPESLEPDAYVGFIEEISEQDGNPAEDRDVQLDLSAVQDLSQQEALERLRAIRLRHLRTQYRRDAADDVLRQAPNDLAVLFVLRRAHTIEKETGLLNLVPDLVQPFLERSSYLRVWYASTVLPLLRFEHEYYQEDGPLLDLPTFESFEGAAGVNVLMSRSTLASREGKGTAETVGRDLRGTVGPWMYGSTQRKRRKLETGRGDGARSRHQRPQRASNAASTQQVDEASQVEPADQLEDWQHTFRWMVTTAVDNFALSVKTIEGWRGPNDVDLGDLDPETLASRDDQRQSQLHLQYCQAALATVYAAESDNLDAIQGAHRIISQISELMGYSSPAELDVDVSLLQTIEQQIGETPQPLESYPQRLFHSDELLKPQQALTMPTLEAAVLLQLFTHSAYLLSNLGFTGSIAQVAKLSFYGDEADAIRLVQKMLSHLIRTSNISAERWTEIRKQLLWLRDWNEEHDSSSIPTHGIFRHLPRATLEQELMKAMGTAGQYNLIRDFYADPSASPLEREDVEGTIMTLFGEQYAAASNGNKTRGSMKKAADLLSTFQPAFKDSLSFRQAFALVSAAHALSFYALTLVPGQPTAPVTIGEQPDPLSLITTVLLQNPHSYTKLDDLISIARNLVIAKPGAFSNAASTSPYSNPGIDFPSNEHARVVQATRLVTGMAIEAALNEDDFETAYSYVVNRLSLNPGSFSQSQSKTSSAEPADDTSWRAAYGAGKHRTTLPSNASFHDRTRRLEQRMDLLSRALSLAPQQALPEILAAWRRCEEELLTILQSEADAEAEADEIADKRMSGTRGSSDLPGGFVADQPPLIQGQARREVGRASRADGEAPMGLFEVARGAAQAFGRMGQGGKQVPHVAQRPLEDMDDSELNEGDRVRKRDMVANAVTGGLARGIGWALGATPVAEHERE